MDAENIALVAAFMTVLGAIATAVMTISRVKSGLSKEVIDNYKTLDNQHRDQIDEWKDRTMKCEDLHRDSIGKIGKMQGQLDTYTSMLKDKDPDTLKFRAFMVEVAEKLQASVNSTVGRDDQILGALTEIGSFMRKINDHMVKTPL